MRSTHPDGGAPPRQARAASAGLAVALLLSLPASRGQAQTDDDIQREVEAMKAQLRELEAKTKKQEELIKKLSDQGAAGQGAPAPAAAKGPARPPRLTQAEGEKPKTAEEEELEKRITEQVMREIQPSLAAANKTFPSQFNPAIGLILDMAGAWGQHDGTNFEFRAAELGLSASVDPFARGYAIITGSPDGFEVEEAALVTTSLPHNVTLKGGRFFADFGRLSKFHDHDLPFVNRPIVLDRFVDGESQADGLEASWLAPTDHYLDLTVGAYNKIGAENTRVDNEVGRDLSEFTYLFRPATYFDLNDSNSIDLGATYAYTPRVVDFTDPDGNTELQNGKPRHLAGIDVTYRYTPPSEASYRGFIWGTEVLYNQEEWNFGDPPDDPTVAIFRGKEAWGLYSYGELRLTRRFRPGFLFDFAQDLKRIADPTRAYSPYLTVWLSEFQRVRLQYTYLDQPGNHESQFFIQWTAILGSHVHGFRDR
jgi:hypothetical protein